MLSPYVDNFIVQVVAQVALIKTFFAELYKLIIYLFYLLWLVDFILC